MKNRCLKVILCTLLISACSAMICFAGGSYWDNFDYEENYIRAEEVYSGEYTTVDTLTLISSDGNYVFSGPDASEDGTVTMTAGNTYNFSLDKVTGGSVSNNATGIVFRNSMGASVLPLNEEDLYAYAGSENLRFISEHVDFVDVTLNESIASSTAYSDYTDKDSPVFGFTGRVVITCTFEMDQTMYTEADLSQVYGEDVWPDEETKQQSYYGVDSEISTLTDPETVTYTLTIDGESSGVYLSGLQTGESGDNYYSTAVSYKPSAAGTFPTSVYTLEISDGSGSDTYDLLDEANSARSTEVDIRFYISDEFTTKPTSCEEVNYREYDASGNIIDKNDDNEEHIDESYDVPDEEEQEYDGNGGLSGAVKVLLVSVAAGAASLALQAGASLISGQGSSTTTQNADGEDTGDCQLTIDSEYSVFINSKEAAVTMPLTITGGSPADQWQFGARSLTDGADRIIRPFTAGRQLVIGFTGEESDPKDISVMAVAFSLSGGKLKKASAIVEFTVRSRGIEAALSNKNELEVTLWEEGNIPGVAMSRVLDSAEYEVTETDSGRRIRMVQAPDYSCKYPEQHS